MAALATIKDLSAFPSYYFQNTGVQAPKYIFTVYRQWWLCFPFILTLMHLYKEYSGMVVPTIKKASYKAKEVQRCRLPAQD